MMGFIHCIAFACVLAIGVNASCFNYQEGYPELVNGDVISGSCSGNYPSLSNAAIFDGPSAVIESDAIISAPAPVNIVETPAYINTPASLSTFNTAVVESPEYISSSIPNLQSTSYASYVSSCGPEPTLEPIRPLRPVILNPVNSPIYSLPAPPEPKPTVIANKCSCTKVAVKPQLFQRVIQVQRNQRFLKRTYKPFVEKIAYSARPRC